MLSICARISAAAGAALIATILALPASAATAATGTSTTGTSTTVRSADQASLSQAIPESATDCNPNPLAAVSECTTVLGSGLKISQITGIAISNVDYTITQVHIEIYGPNGVIHNCPNINLPAFDTAGCTWLNPHPNTNMTGGDYCSTAWEHIAGGNYARLSTECIDVHP
jgi:hypothetical protein